MSRLHMWQLFESAIPRDVVDDINAHAEKNYKLEQGTVMDGSLSNSEDPQRLKDVRNSKIVFFSSEGSIRNLLYGFVEEANRSAFGFDITSMGDIQYTQYEASEGGHYDWHHDVDWFSPAAYSRKLSIVAQLSDPSDYDGGDFVFRGVENPPADFKRKGSILVFPSYIEHKVEPITGGTRKSLVAWFEGPRWR